MQVDFTLGKRLKQARQAKGLNKSQLGAAVGTSGTSINNIEIEVTKKPSAELLAALASYLQVDLQWLLTGKGQTPVNTTHFSGNTITGDQNTQAGGSVTHDSQQEVRLLQMELEGLKKENELLKQMIDLLKGR